MAAGASSLADQVQSSVGSRSTPPSAPSGKAAAALPKITEVHDGVELNSLRNGELSKPTLPIEEDIMQLARLGEVGAIQKLFDSKKFTSKYQDEEGITPLHWAAINNQFAMCKFLLDAGADVNAKGGDSVATPAMWAAQRCHYYIVNLLLQRGADPLLTDVQGYNILHLATIDGNAFLLVLLLHSGIPIDVTDPQGHTSLMWAAYKGFPVCVDLLLRWGANVNAADEGGLTPLHWALVKGSLQCVQKIVEYGADRTATTRDGKTPSSVATEMGTVRVWQRSLSEYGYNSDGNPKTFPMGLATVVRNKSILSKFFFLWPFLTILAAMWIVSNMSLYASVPLVLAVLFGFQWIAQQVVNGAPSEFRALQKTPYLAGVFAGTLFWVGVRYVTHVLPVTWSANPLLNILFIITYSLTTYFYIYSMIEDPGFVPKMGSRNQQRAAISELFDNWKFDEDNFCIPCMVRKPLRSKHCRRCGRCVAKHDHHCPWVHNCVGVNNLRHFVSYILSLEIGIILFVRLVIFYIDKLPPSPNTQCHIVNSTVCDLFNRDTFTLVLTLWASLQLIWVTMLCAVQLVQISRNQTTMENMRGPSIDQPHTHSHVATTALAAGTTSLDAPGVSAEGQATNLASGGHSHGHHHRTGFFKQWKRLLGLDAFLATAQGGFGVQERSTRRRNNFSRGLVTNCRDFWCDPAPIFGKRGGGSAMLGGEVVDYYRMYEAPLRMRGSGVGRRVSGYMSVADEDPEAGV